MAYFHSPQIVKDGLVLLLDAANTKSYPGSGTTWFDRSGNSNNGTLTNGPTFSSANGGSIVFDGVDDYVSVNNASSLNPGSNSFSIDCWVLQKDTGFNGIVEARGSNLHGFLYILNYPSSGGAGLFLNTTLDAGQNTYSSTVSTFSDTLIWMFISVVVNRGLETIDFYKNGIKQGNSVSITSSGTVDPGSDYRYWIAADRGGDEANVNISMLRHYNRALTASEILQNYNATKGRFGL
jgi:hypothetical protein